MVIEFLWYSTAVFAIWGSSLGGLSIPAVGLIYPFRLVAAILLFFLIWKNRREGWGLSWGSWYTFLPILCYMILHSILSLLWAEDIQATAKVILNFLFVAAFFVIFLSRVKDKKKLDRLLITISANFLVILFIGVYEILTNNYLFCDPAGVDMAWRTNAFGLSYPVVCFTNPNNFAFTISLTIPLMLYVLDEALRIKGWQCVTLKVLIIVLSFFVIMQTCSRLGYIVFFLVIGIYLGIQFKKSKLEIAVAGLLTVFLLLALTGTFTFKFEHNVQGKTNGPEPITEISTEDTSTEIRLTLLKMGLQVTRDTWGLGAGAKNSPAFIKGFTDLNTTNTGITDYHFYYMELMADYGIIPLVAMLFFQGGAIFAAIYVLLKKKEQRWLAVVCLPGAVGFALASGNCSSSMFVYIMWIQFAIWSMLTRTSAKDCRILQQMNGSRRNYADED